MFGLILYGNVNLGILFLVIGVSTMISRYFNVQNCLLELGFIDSNKEVSADCPETWTRRVNYLVEDMGHNYKLNIGIYGFCLSICIFLLIGRIANIHGVTDGNLDRATFIHDFYYQGTSKIPYSQCRLENLDATVADEEVALADYIFLSSWAYLDPNAAQIALDDWFGIDVAFDQYHSITKHFQARYEGDSKKSVVKYSLVDFPKAEKSIITIRGTINGLDALTYSQLWIPAATAQLYRALIPLGRMWNPVLHLFVKSLSFIEANGIRKVSHYREITTFANEMKQVRENIFMTGYSLGGGIALISGGQSQNKAIAISGPNNMFSRDTVSQSITVEDINNYMFNLIPDRDPIAMLDDKGRRYQRIECNSSLNDPLDCHSLIRTLCEVLYSCGSHNRPVLCNCHDEYGYPKPEATGIMTYEEACPSTNVEKSFTSRKGHRSRSPIQ